MIDMATDGPLEIELTDPELETAAVVTRFLDLIVHAEITRDSWRMRQHVLLGLFLKKYDCPTATKVLLLHLGKGYDGGIKSFIIGAALDNADICAAALHPPFQKWEDNPGRRKKSEVKDALANTRASKGSLFNTATLPIEWVSHMPLEYRWALDRAWITVGDTDDLPVKFSVLLQDAKGE